jgi:hypothetical protein
MSFWGMKNIETKATSILHNVFFLKKKTHFVKGKNTNLSKKKSSFSNIFGHPCQ